MGEGVTRRSGGRRLPEPGDKGGVPIGGRGG